MFCFSFPAVFQFSKTLIAVIVFQIVLHLFVRCAFSKTILHVLLHGLLIRSFVRSPQKTFLVYLRAGLFRRTHNTCAFAASRPAVSDPPSAGSKMLNAVIVFEFLRRPYTCRQSSKSLTGSWFFLVSKPFSGNRGCYGQMPFLFQSFRLNSPIDIV